MALSTSLTVVSDVDTADIMIEHTAGSTAFLAAHHAYVRTRDNAWNATLRNVQMLPPNSYTGLWPDAAQMAAYWQTVQLARDDFDIAIATVWGERSPLMAAIRCAGIRYIAEIAIVLRMLPCSLADLDRFVWCPRWGTVRTTYIEETRRAEL